MDSTESEAKASKRAHLDKSTIQIIVFLLVFACIALPLVWTARPPSSAHRCLVNLKQLAIIFSMYAHDRHDAYPPLTPTPGCFMFDLAQTYPDYINDLSILICPEDHAFQSSLPEGRWEPKDFGDRNSYFYLGYVLTNAEEGKAFIKVCTGHLGAEKWLRGEVPAPEGKGSGGGNVFLPFAADVARRLPAQVADAEIPVVCERPGHHKEGVHVLYMDGHIDMVPIGSKWPADAAFLKALEALNTLAALSH